MSDDDKGAKGDDDWADALAEQENAEKQNLYWED